MYNYSSISKHYTYENCEMKIATKHLLSSHFLMKLAVVVLSNWSQPTNQLLYIIMYCKKERTDARLQICEFGGEPVVKDNYYHERREVCSTLGTFFNF